MADLTDETLMAYADGQLDPVRRATVEAAVRQDPQARERLKIFVATGEPLAKFFDPQLKAPVPDHLVSLVLNDKKPRNLWDRLLSFSKPRQAFERPRLGTPHRTTVFALGAVKLVAIGALILYLRQASNDPPELVALEKGQIYAQGALAEALETVPSGKKVLSAAKIPL